MLCCRKVGVHNYLSRSPNTSTSRQCHGNHHNNRLKCMISVTILTGKVSHCFCLQLSFGKYRYKYSLGTTRLLQPKRKERHIILTWRILFPAPKCTQPGFPARDFHGLLHIILMNSESYITTNIVKAPMQFYKDNGAQSNERMLQVQSAWGR